MQAPAGAAVLALDTGSPVVSIALAEAGCVVARRSLPQAQSSRLLLPAIDEALAAAERGLVDLAGLVVLAGPGSFTGLRIGLATALGLHQATGVPAATLPTLEVLAVAAPTEAPAVLAAIDARRGEWVLQPFGGRPRQALAPPRRLGAAELAELESWPRLADAREAVLHGFGSTALARSLPASLACRLLPVEPDALAAAAAQLAGERLQQASWSWDAAALTRPLYSRPPAVSLPAG